MSNKHIDILDLYIRALVDLHGEKAVRDSLKRAIKKKSSRPKGRPKRKAVEAVAIWLIVEHEALRNGGNVSKACRELEEYGGVLLKQSPSGPHDIAVINNTSQRKGKKDAVMRSADTLRKAHQRGANLILDTSEGLRAAQLLLGLVR
jgi:hypothetical protein